MLGKSCVLLIFLMLFGEAYGVILVGDVYRILLSSFSFLALLIYIFFHKIKYTKYDILPFRFVIVSWILLIISLPFWTGTHNIYSYVGLVVAWIVYLIDLKYANKLIRLLLILSLVLTSIEFVTKEFLFVNTVNGIEMNEKELGGAIGVFRAKGLFYGPTLLGMFVSAAYLLNNRNISYLLLALCVSFFANARLGIVLLSVPLTILLFKNEYKKYLIWIILLFVLIGAYSLTNASESVERLLSVNKEGSQDARIYYWLSGVNLFLNYSLPHLFFGNNGFFTDIYDNNPESGWICLLTDNGILGFLFYLLPLLYCFSIFLKRREYFLSLIVIVFAAFNFAITYHLSGTGNFMYWLVMFEFLNKAVYGKSKMESYSIQQNE